MRSVVIYPEPGYLGDAFTTPAQNNWHLSNLEIVRQLKEAGCAVKVWPCEVDTGNDIGLAFDHPTYDCKIPDTALCVNLEPPVIRPRFFSRLHGWPYKRILTCCKPYCDDKKVFWHPFPIVGYNGPLSKHRNGEPEGVCRVAISGGDKKITLPDALYNHPEAMYERRRQIYLAYGKHIAVWGWGWHNDPEIMKNTAYCGPTDNKIYTLSKYKIATVIENQVIDGFTSEKYWDAHLAGCQLDYCGSWPDYSVEDALPSAWAKGIVDAVKLL